MPEGEGPNLSTCPFEALNWPTNLLPIGVSARSQRLKTSSNAHIRLYGSLLHLDPSVFWATESTQPTVLALRLQYLT